MDAEPPLRQSLPPAVVDVAAERVSAVALYAAILLPGVHVLHAITQPALFNDLNRLASVAAVLMAAGVVALRQTGVAPASTVLRLGMVLEVVVALALSLVETTAEPGSTSLVIGMSTVALWILVVGVAVPNRPAWTLATGITAASMWPLAYVVNALLGTGHVRFAPFLSWLLLNYGAAVVAYVIGGSSLGAATDPSDDDDLGGYRLVARIGEGGMGEVWEAAHKMLARSAAIKIIRPAMTMQIDRQADMAAARFRREANLIARLQSPHTVYLYDFGVSGDGRFYYVMELLDGISLQTLVEDFGPVSDGRAIAILSHVCQSLHEAHERDLVHRDLKPSNVMVCQVAFTCDFVKVLDFGLAKSVVDAGSSNLTMVGTATGTPGYIAPENATGEGTLDRRADIYALGCVAYFLLTGTPVFQDANPGRLALLHVRQKPAPPSSRTNRPIAPDLEALVMQCLAKSPRDRPATMAVVAERLAQCAVDPWTSADAARWWSEHLPIGSRWRRLPSHANVPVRPSR